MEGAPQACVWSREAALQGQGKPSWGGSAQVPPSCLTGVFPCFGAPRGTAFILLSGHGKASGLPAALGNARRQQLTSVCCLMGLLQPCIGLSMRRNPGVWFPLSPRVLMPPCQTGGPELQGHLPRYCIKEARGPPSSSWAGLCLTGADMAGGLGDRGTPRKEARLARTWEDVA